MLPELDSAGAPSTATSRTADDAALVAAAQAQLAAARNQPLAPAQRAVEGFRVAASTTAPGAGDQARAIADAGTNARTALQRGDLPSTQSRQVQQVLEHLGNAVVDGKIDPHINNTFREHLYDLATAPAGSSKFNGALAQMTRAAQVLDQVELAPGTKLGYDVGAHQPTGRTGLPILDVPKIDADLYFKTQAGVVHVESAKQGANTLASELVDSRSPKRSALDTQVGRQATWRAGDAPANPRALGFFMLDKEADFTGLMDGKNLDALQKAVGDVDARRVVIGDRAYSVSELRDMGAKGVAAAKPQMAAYQQQWEAAHPGQTFRPRQYYQEHMGTPERTMALVGKQYGEPVPALSELAQPGTPGALRSGLGGGAAGAAAAAGVTLISLAHDGKLSWSNAGQVAGAAGQGAALGTLSSLAERAVHPTVDRIIGPTVERAGSAVAARVAGVSVADAAGAGAAARTFASRAAGSTAVGVAISAGISIYQNRDGLAHGDSKAIGNVTADTAVGAASVGASVAVGAAVGSVVPVVGTAVGAVAGLAVGVGVAYGAQISGARDAIAHAASDAVDTIKGWF